MRKNEIHQEMLNAYVDGELARGDAASVARAAAENPAVAAQIATLRELKAGLADVAPGREIKLPASGGVSLTKVVFAAAASVAIFVIAASLYLLPVTEPEGKQWAHFLQSQHRAWTFANDERDAKPLPVSGPASLLPLNLESSRLTFVGHEEIKFFGQVILRTGYKGTRGCRVSLFVLPAGIVLDEKSFATSLLMRKWDIQNQGFALMADGMAKKRFEGLAKAVEKALRAGSGLDRRTRQQLAQARRTSPPCRA